VINIGKLLYWLQDKDETCEVIAFYITSMEKRTLSTEFRDVDSVETSDHLVQYLECL